MRSSLPQAFGLPAGDKAAAQAAIAGLLEQYPASAALHLLNDWAQGSKQPGRATLLHSANPLWTNCLLQQVDEAPADITQEGKIPVVPAAEETSDLSDSSVQEDSSGQQPEPTADFEGYASEEDELPLEEEELPVDDTSSGSRLSAMLEEQAAVLKQEPAAGLETLIPIDPHHAIDYFGSQGIRPEEREKPAQPVFTQKVHRFTDWLKQMKRTNFAQAAAEVSPQQEAQVAGLALASNEAGNIYTEAMAEVYIKQGRPDQAAHIYQKLMEIYPAKRAYFAALLEKIS